MRGGVAFGCAVCALMMVGCSVKRPVGASYMGKKRYEPPQNVEVRRPPGSLFSGYDNLVSDVKAYNVGDILFIRIRENIQGSGGSNTQSARDNSLDFSLPSPEIFDRKLYAINNFAKLSHTSKNAFKGSAKTQRSANLIATVSARVVKVYPNGNLFIVGKKEIFINNDKQELLITGIVHPNYINSDNTIDSSFISDMHVEYNGKGYDVATQSPGWLSRFISTIWPL